MHKIIAILSSLVLTFCVFKANTTGNSIFWWVAVPATFSLLGSHWYWGKKAGIGLIASESDLDPNKVYKIVGIRKDEIWGDIFILLTLQQKSLHLVNELI
jgi:hypothetical protein